MGAHGEGRKDTYIYTQKKVVCKPGDGAEVNAEGCARRRTLRDLLHPGHISPRVPVASNSYPAFLEGLVFFFNNLFFITCALVFFCIYDCVRVSDPLELELPAVVTCYVCSDY